MIVPFVNVARDGTLDLHSVDERAALRCALSRVCAYCGLPQGFPLVFVGTRAELEAGTFDRPGMHEACAGPALDLYAGLDASGSAWLLLATGSFTVQRPDRRDAGQRISFRPGSAIWTRPYARSSAADGCPGAD